MGEHLKVLVEDLSSHPHCAHGPTLLFRRTFDSSDKIEEFFACSACRNRKECSFYQLKEDAISEEAQSEKKLDSSLEILNDGNTSNSVLQKIWGLPEIKRVFCHTCGVFLMKDYDEHSAHNIQHGVSNKCLQKPTTLLRPLSNDKREAQYFFAESSLKCITSIFQQLKINKVICVGTPRLHEYLKFNQKSLKIQSILLDFDRRLQNFYDSSEYWHYNMFNHYFFAGPEAKLRFFEFLKETSNEKCCIITDPPFGCRTEPLAYTIQTITREYQNINDFYNLLPVFWIFPYYMESYVRSVLPQMEMIDYKVNYTNHDLYHSGENGRKQGSPVRIFTNVPHNLIKLPVTEGYRFCSKCKRSVDNGNIHCNFCKRCPSKNGSTYIHCKLCEICVKPSYKHCFDCNRCTQVAGHCCVEYQKNLTCAICLRKGHNEINCVEWFRICGKNVQTVIKKCKKLDKIGKRMCLVCFNYGHNEKCCSKRGILLKEFYFLDEFTNILNSNC